MYPSATSFYKSGLSEPERTSYYCDSHGYEVNHHEPQFDEYRRLSENLSTINEQTATASTEWGEGVNTTVVLDYFYHVNGFTFNRSKASAFL